MTYIELLSKVPSHERHHIPSFPLFIVENEEATAVTIATKAELANTLQQYDETTAWVIPVRGTDDEAKKQAIEWMMNLAFNNGVDAMNSYHVPDLYNPKMLLPAVMVLGFSDHILPALLQLSGIDFLVSVSAADGLAETEIQQVEWE